MLMLEEQILVHLTKEHILSDFQLAVESRKISILGRKEVFLGKAKFGIFGDGKEVAQLALAKFFKNGDWRSGYYRDQTLMMSIGALTPKQFFAQLYAHTDVNYEPSSAGRQMNSHFGTRFIDKDGHWKAQTRIKNSVSDISTTAGQMARIVGLGYASKLYRNNSALSQYTEFSQNGNEVIFGTIGDASVAQGVFWEAMNAVGAIQIPMVMSIWDDGYGISVESKYQITKGSVSELMEGFRENEESKGLKIFTANGWDYLELIKVYEEATNTARTLHIPCLVHVKELTQQLGHSSSGSHERYKSKERLDWEAEKDCILHLKEWILSEGVASEDELNEIELQAEKKIKSLRTEAWNDYLTSIKTDMKEAVHLLESVAVISEHKKDIATVVKSLKKLPLPGKKDIIKYTKQVLRRLKKESSREKEQLKNWLSNKENNYSHQYSSFLYDTSERSPENSDFVAPQYSASSPIVDGRMILNKCFDEILSRDPRFFIIGEDVGKIGDVNQGLAGLQEKYGDLRLTDTGIRESTIVGQGLGAAIRGLRPIVEIQYLDYLLYAHCVLSDDLATLHYRSFGGQKAPLIIRTRGHRLEGIWHSGSPMGMILNSLKGIYVLTPRDMTQAVAMYNTLMEGESPALIIESLNGYRMKEKMPENIAKMRLPLGVPDILREGDDITLVTYGSLCKIVILVVEELAKHDISVEVIDLQTLIPFDKPNVVNESLKKTNRLVIVDEDVEGGASAYISQQILEKRGGYDLLDSKPITITARNHRTAYGSDGDYFSKPNEEIIFDRIYEMMNEANPSDFPPIY